MALTILVACPVLAQDGKEKKKKGKGGGQTPQAVAALQKQLDTLDLSDEQKTKIKDVVGQFTTRLVDAQKKLGAIVSPEARKASAEALQKAKAEGKKGKELRDAAAAALNLSVDDRAKYDAAQKELNAVVADFRQAVAAVLTEEQKAKAGLNAPAKGKGKGKAKANS
ncbi:MAG: hypothetical protein U0935_08990 [Pirellulales bacterium]